MPFNSNNRNSAFQGDVVELLTDLPKDNFKRGQRGTVVADFDEPAEAYDLEMQDESGTFAGFAYSVKPDQFVNLSRSAFVRAMEAVEKVDLVVAERELRTATELRPDYIGSFVMSLLATLPDTVEQQGLEDNVSYLIPLLRLANRIDPNYEFASSNLAVAFLNFGVAKAQRKNYLEAIELFYSALGIETDLETETRIKTNLVMAFTTLGRESFQNGRIEEGFGYIRTAFLILQDKTTRRNLGLAYGNLGVFYMKSERFELAMEQFERAEDFGVVVAEFINAYGVCLVFLGRINGATQTFERVLVMDPANENAKFNMSKLKQFSNQRISIPDLKVFANQGFVATEDLLDFDGRGLMTLAWRQPQVSAREFVSVP